MKTFKELYEACCAACEKRTDIEEVKEPTGDLKKACWKGYTAIGMKMKNGRKVPNCVPANEDVELDEGKDPMVSNWKNSVSRRIKRASPEHQTKLNAHLQKAKSASDFEQIHQKLDKLGIKEESDRKPSLTDALAKIKNDFSNPPAGHKEAEPKKPTPAPKPKTGGGMDYYPKAPYGKRDLGDSVEMNGKTIKETSPTAGKNVVPPPAGNIGTSGGLVREEENENKPLGKVMRAGDGKKKFKVFVKNSKGNVVKVGFGDPNMEIKRDDPERRKNFRARHNCATAKDRTTPKYWSCRQWRASSKVEA